MTLILNSPKMPKNFVSRGQRRRNRANRSLVKCYENLSAESIIGIHDAFGTHSPRLVLKHIDHQNTMIQ